MEAPRPVGQQSWNVSPASQLIFFAVLEGLYRDGLANEDVDLIIPPDKDEGLPDYNEHFVYACPLCHPAFDAFRVYRMRPRFFGIKGGGDRFGPGLPPSVTAQLKSADRGVRLLAIQGLIEGWVSDRMTMMRLSEVERAELTAQMDAGRQQGMEALKRRPADDRKKCTICEGSFAACKR